MYVPSYWQTGVVLGTRRRLRQCIGMPVNSDGFRNKLKGRFEIKTTKVGLREDKGKVKEARILNRVIRVNGGGWEYEADQRHADLII